MRPSAHTVLPLPFVLFFPLLALAQQSEPVEPRQTGGPLSWFWMVAIGLLIIYWTYRTLRRDRREPPIDPTLRGPHGSSR